jgi:hypothetical protein
MEAKSVTPEMANAQKKRPVLKDEQSMISPMAKQNVRAERIHP